MLILFGLLILCFVLYYWIPFRLAFFHPVSTISYSCRDVFNFLRYNLIHLAPTGKLDCYSAHFGGGKTLSIVHYVCRYYKRYNNRLVYDMGLKKMVKQKVHVISNVHFNSIPYEKLDSLAQVVSHAQNGKELDKWDVSRTVYLVIIDEASVQLNSRNFKSNIDPTFLNTLLTSRHYHINILYSSQKFHLTDKLMRDVTQRVIQCKKIWRLMVQYEFSADDLEFATNPMMVRPLRRTGFFIRNKDYDAYDTLAVVDKLQKSIDDNDMLTEKEILENRQRIIDNEGIVHRSKRAIKRSKKKTA